MRTTFQELMNSLLYGDGRAPSEQRALAFAGEGLPAPLDTLVTKVARTPAEITDADFAAAQAAGFTQDQVFELVVCAAVGQASRLYSAGLDALADATSDGGPEHAA
jgi:hypothetical protein